MLRDDPKRMVAAHTGNDVRLEGILLRTYKDLFGLYEWQYVKAQGLCVTLMRWRCYRIRAKEALLHDQV